MTDKFVETTTTSGTQRIKNSLSGVVFGLIMFIGSFYLLSWNEERTVAQDRNLHEGLKSVISVSADTIDPNNNGKLVHVSGFATTNETIFDQEFGIARKAIKLERDVKMYQWRETKQSDEKETGSGSSTTTTTYDYSKIWSTQYYDSSEFEHPEGHENPEDWPYDSQFWNPKVVTLGAFTLTSRQIKSIGDNSNTIQLEGDLTGIPDAIVDLANTENVYQAINVDPTTLPEDLKNKLKEYNHGYYLGESASAPKVGDIQITFKEIPPLDISIIAKQVNNTFEPYKTKTGTLSLLRTGKHSAEEMLEKEMSINVLKCWAFRIGGFLLMTLGLSTMFKPLVLVANFIPVFGAIAHVGVGLVSLCMAFVLTLVTIAFAWVRFHIGG